MPWDSRGLPLSKVPSIALVLACILAACAGGTANTTLTTSTVSTAPSTTALTTSTTELVVEPVDICARGTVWDAGSTYAAPCFLVPLSFQPAEDGWRSVGVGVEWLEALWVDPATSEQSIRFGTLAFRPSDGPEEVMDSILALEGVTALTDPVATAIGGADAVTVDLETAPVDLAGQENLCAKSVAYGINLPDARGSILLDITALTGGANRTFGLGACLTFRVWVVEAEGNTITVLATTEDEARFDEMIDVVERLLETTTFGGA